MGLQNFLTSAFRASMRTLDAEQMTIGGSTIYFIADMIHASSGLGVAAIDAERTLVVQFPADPSLHLESGMTVQARGLEWKIASADNAIQTGASATTITLVEPERRREY